MNDEEEQLVTPAYYKEKVIDEVIRKPGRWISYYEKTPYLVDMPMSLRNLEKLLRELK